jgi:hypothetical protein
MRSRSTAFDPKRSLVTGNGDGEKCSTSDAATQKVSSDLQLESDALRDNSAFTLSISVITLAN